MNITKHLADLCTLVDIGVQRVMNHWLRIVNSVRSRSTNVFDVYIVV